jgi:hypothetical protein
MRPGTLGLALLIPTSSASYRNRKMLFQIFIAILGLFMPLVFAAPVPEDNPALANFTSLLETRGLITAANTCPATVVTH